LSLNIFMEENMINAEEEGKYNNLPYETNAYEDKIVQKVALKLKEKGLNLDSAFKIFDRDDKGEISIQDFHNTCIFTLKCATGQNEIEHLIKILYSDKNRTILNKIDFFKIFNQFLSGDGPFETDIVLPVKINQNNSSMLNPKDNLNTSQKNFENKMSINDTRINPNINANNNSNMFINNNSRIENNNKSINNLSQSKLNNSIKNSNNSNVSRSVEQLCLELKNNIFNRGTIIKNSMDLWKCLDKDNSIRLDQNELKRGFTKYGVSLNNYEFREIWKELSHDNPERIQEVTFELFEEFYDKYFKDKNIFFDSLKTGYNISNPELYKSTNNNFGKNSNLDQSDLRNQYGGTYQNQIPINNNDNNVFSRTTNPNINIYN